MDPVWRRASPFDRSRVALAAVASLVAILVTFVAITRVARSVAESKARARGLTVFIDRVTLGVGVIRFRGVSVRAESIPDFAAEFSDVDVSPSLGLSVRGVFVHGGTVRLRGSATDLERRFSDLSKGDAAGAAGGVSDREIGVDGVDVTWMGFASDEKEGGRPSELRIWGSRYGRRQGIETASADLVRVGAPGGDLDVENGSVEAVLEGGHRTLRRVHADETVIDVDVDGLLGRGTESVRPPSTSVARHQAGKAPPSPLAPRDPKRGAELRRRLGTLSEKLSALLPSHAPLALDRVRFVVHHGAQHLNVGPAAIELRREPAFVQIAVRSGASEGATPLALDVTLPAGDASVDAAISGGPLPLATLGVKEGDFGLFDVGRAEMRISGKASLDSSGGTFSVSGNAGLEALSIREPKLARDPVQGLALGVATDAVLSTDGSRVELQSFSVDVGKVTVRGKGTLERSDGDAKLALHVEVPLAACADLLASTPRALVPMFSGLAMSGTFTLSGDVAFDTRRPADTRVTFSGANGCRVTAVPETLAPDRFKRPFQRTVVGPDGRETTVESGPGAADWVPLYDVSSFVPTAVVVCEDAHFFTHDGFDGKSLEDSIRDDLKAGRFVRGGSTVSMQLAKNLYLAREKTLSRKLQEAVLTLLLEQTLGKEAILELYLNIVEFGPGLYGIGPAARHYFGVTAKDLSLAQSLYLISLLPNPKIHHFKSDGTLSDTWSEYLRHLMEIAHKIRKVTDADLAEGLKETVRFGVAADRPAPEETPDGSASPDVLGMEPRDDGP